MLEIREGCNWSGTANIYLGLPLLAEQHRTDNLITSHSPKADSREWIEYHEDQFRHWYSARFLIRTRYIGSRLDRLPVIF